MWLLSRRRAYVLYSLKSLGPTGWMRRTVAITPEEPRLVYWTKVSIDNDGSTYSVVARRPGGVIEKRTKHMDRNMIASRARFYDAELA
jgi:hypothetical protein